MSTIIQTFSDLGGEIKILLRQVNPLEPQWSATNPSIAKGPDGEYLMTIRSSNYYVPKSGFIKITVGRIIRSRVWLCSVDPDTLTISNLREVGMFGKYLTRGAEDCRLFWRESGWTFSAVLLHAPEINNARMATFRLFPELSQARMIRVLPGPVEDRPEKNWMAPDVATEKFEFNYSPTQVFKDGKVVGDHSNDVPQIRGGSGLVLQDDGTYLAVVHSTEDNSYKIWDQSGFQHRTIYVRDYVHHFARYNADGHLTHLSDPFVFKSPGIEFASGMVEHGDDLIISYGARDVYACLARIPKSKVLGLLNPIR